MMGLLFTTARLSGLAWLQIMFLLLNKGGSSGPMWKNFGLVHSIREKLIRENCPSF